MEENKVKEEQKHECNCGEDCKCKKGSGLIIVIAVVFCVVTFVAGLFVGPKVFTKSEDNEKTKDCVTTENEKTEENDTKEFNLINYDIEEYLQIYLEKNVLLDSFNMNVTDFSKLDNQKLLYLGLILEGKFPDSITLDELNNDLTRYFGVTAKGEDVYGNSYFENGENTVIYKYDSDSKTFEIADEHYYLCFESPTVLNRIVDVEVVNGNQVVVKVKKAFAVRPHTGYATDFYPSYNDLRNNTNLLFTNDMFYIENTEIGSLAENIYFNSVDNDKLHMYEYTFDVVDNQLVLKSYIF